MKTIGCPRPMDLIANENKTLKFLLNDSETSQSYPNLAHKANQYYRRKANVGFTFDAYLDVVHEDKEMRLYIGALIISEPRDKYRQVSYYLAVANGRNEPNDRLLRKFHFDFAPPDADRRVPHPKSHIQYGGGVPPGLSERKFCDAHLDHMDTWFSEPRIPSAPICLALLLHLVFQEFRDETAHKFASRPEWRNMVKSNERFMLRDFHSCCLRVLDGPQGDSRLLFDVFYGE